MIAIIFFYMINKETYIYTNSDTNYNFNYEFIVSISYFNIKKRFYNSINKK